MKIKKTIEKVPGGLMVVPLMLGALINTIDQAHISFIENMLKSLGAPQTESGHYELLRIGGFTEELFTTGALTLIALFLFCAGSQMNFRVGGRALKKGILVTSAKYFSGVAIGYLFALIFDPMHGILGLSTMTIIAAMTNSNGGMYAALTGQYGNRSDVGAVSILSLNDGPFMTMLALGMLGTTFPAIAFISVLLPIALGMLLGNLDEDIREFLSPGETITIPFFSFALGTGMNFGSFFNPEVVGAGLLLGFMTVIITGGAGILLLKLFREKSQIAGIAEGSTAGNAVATPEAVAVAAASSASAGSITMEQAQQFEALANLAAAQISIAVLTTAVLCPIAVILWDKYQRSKGIDAKMEDVEINSIKKQNVV